jgi:hypothetical protein
LRVREYCTEIRARACLVRTTIEGSKKHPDGRWRCSFPYECPILGTGNQSRPQRCWGNGRIKHGWRHRACTPVWLHGGAQCDECDRRSAVSRCGPALPVRSSRQAGARHSDLAPGQNRAWWRQSVGRGADACPIAAVRCRAVVEWILAGAKWPARHSISDEAEAGPKHSAMKA